MDDTPKLTKEEIESALKEYGLQDIGVVVTDKHWHLGNEMGNLRMPVEHLIQSCIDYLKRNKMPIPQPIIEEPVPQEAASVETIAVDPLKKSTKFFKEKVA